MRKGEMRHAKTEKAAELAAGGLYAVQSSARTPWQADPDPAPVADTTTYTDWEDLFGVGGSAYLTTKDIGRIWTDKSVSTQDITLPGTNIDGLENNTVKKEADADFLVALSGLGSAATIVDQDRHPHGHHPGAGHVAQDAAECK